jgi:hypothetical protein
MKTFISVRSYMNPRVDLLQNGKPLAKFFAPTVAQAKAKARAYAQKQDIEVTTV